MHVVTVDSKTFEDLVVRLTFGHKPVKPPRNYQGVWYKRPDGFTIGLRISNANGPTIDIISIENVKTSIARNYKVNKNEQ